jgi:hypothetical protein
LERVDPSGSHRSNFNRGILNTVRKREQVDRDHGVRNDRTNHNTDNYTNACLYCEKRECTYY